MKKNILIVNLIIAILIFASLRSTFALAISQNASNSATTGSPLDQKINELKDRIASRVAQLNLVEKRGILGTVTDSSDTQITLSDLLGNVRFIDIDELTKFSSPSAGNSFGISDIKKGQMLGILGLYNKESQRILARFVDVEDIPEIVHGAVSAIDDKNYTITVSTKSGENVKVDIETTTKTFSYSKNTDLVSSGFSKITNDEHIIVVGFPDIKNNKLLIGSRIIVFPDIPKDPTIPQQALSPDKSVTPSTGSGTKLVPIVK